MMQPCIQTIISFSAPQFVNPFRNPLTKKGPFPPSGRPCITSLPLGRFERPRAHSRALHQVNVEKHKMRCPTLCKQELQTTSFKVVLAFDAQHGPQEISKNFRVTHSHLESPNRVVKKKHGVGGRRAMWWLELDHGT